MTTVTLKNASSSFIDSFGFSEIPVVGDYVTRNVKGSLNEISTALGQEIDGKIFGYEERNLIRGRKLSEFSIQTSSYAETIGKIFGRVKISGNIIWSSKVKTIEEKQAINQGGKGSGTKVERKTETRFRYFVNLAIALCEGEIDNIERIWADTNLINISDYCTAFRIHKGTENQAPDSLIESFEGIGKTPAYRGLAYIVLEDFEITEFRGRIPNFFFEVVRNLNFASETSPEKLIEGVNIIPGCGEFVYDTLIHQKLDGLEIAGKWYQKSHAEIINQNNAFSKADSLVALDNLQNNFPNLEYVSLICCWFADNLDIANCLIEPRVEYKSLTKTIPSEWSVAGLNRASARQVTLLDGKPIYGGTPSDASILRFIDECKNRGLKVKFYPMIFVDSLTKPWRGKITGNAIDVVSFFTKTKGYNEFILHYANLVKNKVDAFIIGTEMKGLTSIRDGNNFPAVDEFINLAAQVKTIMGASTKISYAADWSEYHSLDGWYNLDPLWASEDIDFIAIDAYFPLTDRPQNGVYDVDEIIAGWESGEGYDWFYSDANRTIKENLSEEFAWKNLSWWWNNFHINPDDNQTNWQPQSKKIWFAEYGFPSVDGASNQPNVFYNPESEDSALPYLSNGYIDFFAQRNAIEGTLLKWQNSPMVEKKFLWAFDARPYPSFPDLLNVWSDGEIWSRGHWFNGKLGNANLADVISEICKNAGLSEDKIDVSNLKEILIGYNISSAETAISMIKDLSQVYFFDIVEGEKIKFLPKKNSNITEIDESEIVFDNKIKKQNFYLEFEKYSQKLITAQVDFNFYSQNNNYQISSVTNLAEDNQSAVKIEVNTPIIFNNSVAENITKIISLEENLAAGRVEFFLSYKYIFLEMGDIIKLSLNNNFYNLRITNLQAKDGRIKVNAVIFDDNFYQSNLANYQAGNAEKLEIISNTHLEILDIPNLNFEVDIDKPHIKIAVCGTSENWQGCAIYFSSLSENTGFQKITEVTKSAKIGFLQNNFSVKNQLIIDEISKAEINLFNAELESISTANMQQFGNLCVIGDEILQFQNAEILSENNYNLSGFYRGLFSTENFMNHNPAERFILLDDNITKIEIPANFIGSKFWIKAVSFGKSLDDVEAKEITFNANSLKPFSPVHLEKKNIGDDIEISWIRRSRFRNNFSSLVEIPLAENSEKYEIDIMQDNDIKRTITANSPSCIYNSASQIQDFGTLQANLKVRIYQISDKTGRGFMSERIL
ncbi:MAG: glycoside hydrolase TIM-barrel-like domain-containing protein [Rickettsiales bacterium]|nr:glycoside hydrolase TIM-barrel-like domain-containing protein [Rickettsiales bacterium]